MTATPPTDPPTPPPDPLFGSSSRYRAGWSRHDWVLGKTGFATIARQLPHLAALSLRLSWIADRRATAVVMACQLATGAFTAFGFLAVNGVFHKLIASGATPAGLHAAVPPALAAAAAAGLNRAADAVARGTATRLKPKVERMAKEELYRCTNETELLAFQQSGLKDIVDSAQFGATWTQYVIDRLVGMVASVMSLVAVAGVLAVLHPVLLALLPLIVLPGAIAAVRTTQRMYRSRLSQLTLSRQHRDISMLMTDASTAEEIRVHAAGAFLLAHFSRLAAKLEAEQARLGRVETRSSLLAGAGTGLTLAVTYTALFLLLDSGEIRQAAAYTAALALRTGTSQLTTLVTRVTGLFEFGLYIADWEQACLEARRQAMPSGGVPVPEPPKRIEALDVRFKYPNSTRLALDGVSLTIEAGQTVALVGHNGSGKTTLAKLLTGLYLPESGAVAWDGVPTTGLDRRQAFGHVALLSQGFFCWPFTVRANIGIGRPDRVADAAALAAAISAAGAEFIHSLPQQADTLLTADYDDGVKPSGGEWQQVGLARAYFRDAPIIVMDEPTAALDPKAEAEVFERVRAGAGSRTVILITHRLASVRHAHQIVVLDHGKVVEVGGHAELLAAGGLYAGLYALQAGQYGIGVVDGDASPPAVSHPA